MPYARNPKQHPPEQIELIKASMREFSWTIPILVDEDDMIIAGHGRVMAGGELGMTEVPVIVARGWSEAQKRAYVIADNRLTELGGWDRDLLKLELAEIAALKFDLALTGFPTIDSASFVTGLGDLGSNAPGAGRPGGMNAATQPDRELSAAEKKLMRNAWRRVMQDWNAIAQIGVERGYFSTDFTKGSLAVYFMRSMFFGDNIPRGATTPYTGHRFFVPGSKQDIASVFLAATKADNLLDSMIWQCQGRPSFNKMFGSLAIHGHRAPADFPATLARALIDEFTKPGCVILDPCHGWGGRMLGFLLSKNAVRYHGFDVDPQTNKGVQAMFDDLRDLVPRKKTADLALQPYEDATLKAGGYDFALTSPPYFDVEKYDGEQSSWRRYPEFDQWVEKFYKPLIQKTSDALKPGAHFALQVGNQSYPLETRACDMAPECGFEVVEKRTTDMRNNFTETAPEDGEIVLILRKLSGARSRARNQAPSADPAEKFGSVLK